MTNETTASQPTEFKGDIPALCRAIDALLTLDASGSLVPHGLGGHARTLLNAASLRLAASQPKSIGDDAIYFVRVEKQYGWKEATAEAYEYFMEDNRRILYSRSPAAQASATILAAPVAWRRATKHGWEFRSLPPTERMKSDGWSALILPDAAAIQEPVMVAEPVVLANIGANGPASWSGAAPMVVDPAGVAGLKKYRVLDEFSMYEGDDWNTDDCVIPAAGYWVKLSDVESLLAATVKAVPSEALEYRTCCDHSDCTTCAGRGGFYRAAPLADKTGGGE